MNTSPLMTAVAALLLSALAACDPSKPPLPTTSSADAPAVGAVSVAESPSSDPSLPSSAVVSTPAAAPTARDDKASRPLGDLTKAEESSAMPKAGQANTHSSPSLDAASAVR